MTQRSGQTLIPESHKDILQSTALAHVATLGPGDVRVVVFVRPEHTTPKDG
jgi:hypothetical protein